MKKNLSEWASIAEIVSATAVVATLIFLIVGIRENTAITRLSVYGDLMQEINQVEALAIEDSDLDRVLSAFYNETTDTLNDSERRTVSSYVGVLFRNYERAYFSREYEVIGDAEWERFSRLICANSRRAKLVGQELLDAEFLTAAFREYMRDSCVGPDYQ